MRPTAEALCSAHNLSAATLKVWTDTGTYEPRALYLSCGDSSSTGLATGSVDLVLTDPPFFDNVHYSELADFFLRLATTHATWIHQWQHFDQGKGRGSGY